MGRADVQTLDYFQDSRVFADMINAYFFRESRLSGRRNWRKEIKN